MPLEEAEGIVCTGLFDDRTETPADYRATILYGKTKGLKLLCANPDIVVDVGDRRIYCAGAIAAGLCRGRRPQLLLRQAAPADLRAGPRAARRRAGLRAAADEILCLGDGIATDIAGAMGEGLDALFVTGGLAAEETGTTPAAGPDPALLAAFLAAARLAPRLAMAYPAISAAQQSFKLRSNSRRKVAQACCADVANRYCRCDAAVAERARMLDTREHNLPVGTICIEDIEIGMARSVSKTIGDREIALFAELSTDHNPVHLDDAYARDTIFEGRIAHGMLTAGLISAVIGEQLPGHGTVYLGQTLKFRAPVRPGDRVEATVVGARDRPRKRRVTLDCACRVGDTVVLEGEALVLAPSRKFD